MSAFQTSLPYKSQIVCIISQNQMCCNLFPRTRSPTVGVNENPSKAKAFEGSKVLCVNPASHFLFLVLSHHLKSRKQTHLLTDAHVLAHSIQQESQSFGDTLLFSCRVFSWFAMGENQNKILPHQVPLAWRSGHCPSRSKYSTCIQQQLSVLYWQGHIYVLSEGIQFQLQLPDQM